MIMTQNEQILEYMRENGSITPLEALKEIGCFRLGARIYDLKHEGHLIHSKNETNNGKHYARYYLTEQQISLEFRR